MAVTLSKRTQANTTLIHVDTDKISSMQRTMNRHLAIAWINARLIERAHHDVDTSIAVYDKDLDFVAFIDEHLFDDLMEYRLRTETHVRSWSIGV